MSLLSVERMQSLLNNMQLNYVQRYHMFCRHFKFYGCTFPFLVQKRCLKVQIFRDLLPPKEPLVPNFNEKRAPTFGEYVAEQDVPMQTFVQSLHFFDRSSAFLLEKSNRKILVFRDFLPPKEVLMSAFSKTDAPTSR